MPPRWPRVGPAAIALAEAEGLHAHARSIALRLQPKRSALTGVLDLACPALMFRARNQAI